MGCVQDIVGTQDLREKGQRAGKTRAGRCPERESIAASQCAGVRRTRGVWRWKEMVGWPFGISGTGLAGQLPVPLPLLPGPSAEPRSAARKLRTALPRNLIAKNF